jgi:sporulation related protein/PilZ domain-containing protein
MIQERRQHSRLRVDGPVFVYADDVHGGFLFDVCEGGLALEGLTAENCDQIIRLSFSLPETNGRIEAGGEIVWSNKWGYRVGLRFADLPEASRQRLKEWISIRAVFRTSDEWTPTFPEFSETREQLPQPVSSIADSASPTPSVENPEQVYTDLIDLRSMLVRPPEVSKSRLGQLLALVAVAPNANKIAQLLLKRRYLAVLLVSVMAVCFGLLLGYLVGRRKPSSQITQVAAREASVSLTDSSSAPARAKAAIAAIEANLRAQPIEPEEFVLQVATMREERNALNLSHSLNQKDFPAFVVKDTHGPFYRVEVGPYSDADSARRDKSDLVRRGFEPILKGWPTE